ncbi:MAG: hypothetical protein PHU67_03920 [Sulfurovum sp.]|nr:hypothetical protein [Sulfurovum sp.]MDD3499287.1 hypothetical protein [Sulfurovum sp.]
MNQTPQRLSIIKLAISIKDIETIQLQISKLRLLRAYPQIQKIIDALEAESYTLSQALIQEYIDNPIEEGHQHVPEENKKCTYTAREQALIDQFDLFVIDDNQDKEDQIIDIHQYLKRTAASCKKPSGPDLDRLLEIDKESSKREKDILSQEDPHFFRKDTQAEKSSITDDAFYIEEKQWSAPDRIAEEAPLESATVSEEEKSETEAERATASQKTATISAAQEFTEKMAGAKENDINCRPIFSIELQLNDASSPKYRLHSKSTVSSDSVKEQITLISDEHGYTKSDVKNVVQKAKEEYYETVELLLLCGLMEDEFGQLTLIQTISAISEKEA